VAGCSNRLQVHGKLEYEDGQPITEMEGCEVYFTSEELKTSARGGIQKDGTFTLMTQKEGDGILPGTYKVSVAQPHPMPERPEKRNPVVALVYEDPEQTPLTAKVDAGHKDFTFKLRRLRGHR
jgi:hypothetical protein